MNNDRIPMLTFAEVKECRYLTAGQIRTMFKIGKTTLHRWVNEGEFPRPICVGKRSMRWPSSQVEAYITAKSAPAVTLEQKRPQGRPRTSISDVYISSGY